MTLEFSLISSAPDSTDTPCAIVGVYAHGVLSSAAALIDSASGGAIKRRIEHGDIDGKVGSTRVLYDLDGVRATRVLVVGLGEQKAFDGAGFKRACAESAQALAKLPVDGATSWLSELEVDGHDTAWRVRIAALAADHAAYRYTATISSKDTPDSPRCQHFALAGSDALAPALAEARAIASGVHFARKLGNTPPNTCNPVWLAEQAVEFAGRHDSVSIDVLEPEKMAELGMHSLLAVARGSSNPPRMIVLEYNGAAKADSPYALVGKGVTFDSGGLNIKPGASMAQMKFDMCGGAGVLGTFVAAVEMKLPLNLVCVVPSVENMPDGNAYRPSDVVQTLSGQTVEVLNTDAEGRLILCDALTYVQRFKPQAIIDAATLTGACLTALGHHASAVMSKHDDLANELLAAGEHTLDRAWRLPLWDDYQSQLESGFADFAHIGGKTAGAITAGCFLSRFTKGQRWAHLDIAGSAFDEGRMGLATGRPVALLSQWLMDRSSAQK